MSNRATGHIESTETRGTNPASHDTPLAHASPPGHAFPHPRTNIAFTLVELLVVVAIIAVLMSILLPALNKARETAKMTVCQSTLRTQGTLLVMYTSDYGGHMPFKPGWAGAITSGLDGSTYEWLMAPYVNAKQPDWTPNPSGHWSVDNIQSKAFWCPAAPIVGKRGWGLQYRKSGDLWGQSGGYSGSLYHLYMDTLPNSGTKDNDDSDGTVNYPAVASTLITYFSQPATNPYRYCDDLIFPTELGGPGGTGIYNQSNSWHMRSTDNWLRPTIFLDGHSNVLKDRRYTDGTVNNYNGYAINRMLRQGVYSTYELVQGKNYGAHPSHKPFEFWIDEY